MLSDADLFSCLQHEPSSAAYCKARQLQSAGGEVLETFSTLNLGLSDSEGQGYALALGHWTVRSWVFGYFKYFREKAAKKGQKKDNRSSLFHSPSDFGLEGFSFFKSLRPVARNDMVGVWFRRVHWITVLCLLPHTMRFENLSL